MAIDVTGFLARTAARIQNRNLASLVAGQGPGGAPLAQLHQATIATKKRMGYPGIIGVRTGAMLAGLTDPGSVNVRSTRDGGSVEVFGGPGGTDKKINLFLADLSYLGWTSQATESGLRKAWRVVKGKPARDFFGVSEIDLDAAGEDLLTTVGLALGFHEE